MNNKFFRFTALLVCMLMVFSLCCCKGDADGDTSSVAESVPLSTNQTESNNSESEKTESEIDSSKATSSVALDSVTKLKYKPECLTLSFYDISASSYGFTYNTKNEPMAPVIQVCEGKTFKENGFKEYAVTVNKYESLDIRPLERWLCKANIALKANTQYTYRAYDKVAQIGSDPATFKTGDSKAKSFSFVHVSDTQVATADEHPLHSAIGTGAAFGKTLEGIKKSNPNPAFLLHTGDIVQNVHEPYWRSMIDDNNKYLSNVPFMAASGNHEASGTDAIFNHFNFNAPEQDTSKGLYYYFDYGDARFIVLNTNLLDGTSKIPQSQYNWLKRTLESNTKKWTIVSMHNPIYSVGKWVQDEELNATSLKLRDQLFKVFARYNVDLVLQGHDHTYSKTYPISIEGKADLEAKYETINSVKYTVNPNGVIYAVNGTSGTQNRKPYKTPDKNVYEIFGESNTNSWANITVENDKLTVKVMYLDNGTPKLWNSYGIIKK